MVNPDSTGYQVTWEQFHQLLTYAPYRPTLLHLVTRWFECTPEPSDELAFRTSAGRVFSAEQIYDAIQSDPDWQYEAYQAAMGLWR
jgi:hypothetical protein